MVRQLCPVFVVLCAACGAVQRPDGGEGLLPVGSQVPALTATDQWDKPVSLEQLRGSPVVVYFYPKDGTPGCTKEACAFRDAWERYEQAGVHVIGVSADDRAAHLEFSNEHELTFPLVPDPDHVWSNAFGVGTTLGMTSRVSFLIGRDGRVAKVYEEVDPGVHATQILEDVKAL